MLTETCLAWGSLMRNCAWRAELIRGYSWPGKFARDGFQSLSAAAAAIAGFPSLFGNGPRRCHLKPTVANSASPAASERDQMIFRFVATPPDARRASLLGNGSLLSAARLLS